MRNKLLSPCIGECKIDGGTCIGCRRSLTEIAEWSSYNMDDRMRLMEKLTKQNPKSYCPECGAPNKCAMEMGKSASTCWCMTLDVSVNPNTQQESCLCKRCLTKEVKE